MALKIVGMGLGRTGTKSLQSALNMLGLGPCHHMVEVFAHPESAGLWIEAAKGKPDWGAIFAGYQSVVDYPGAQFWRELTAYYPDAKVLHTVRDPDEWFELHSGHHLLARRPRQASQLHDGILQYLPEQFWGASA